VERACVADITRESMARGFVCARFVCARSIKALDNSVGNLLSDRKLAADADASL
jgi:hypothetical protein